MITYRAEELAQSGRMLTIFALYVDVAADETLMLSHFGKAREMARWPYTYISYAYACAHA